MNGVRYVPTAAAKAAVQGREADIVRAIGVPWNGRADHVTCPDPRHGDQHPSWRLMPDGCAVCTCRPPHSVFDVIGYVEGVDFEAAKIRAAEIIGRSDLIVDPAETPAGLTLAAYAEAKLLPLDFLRELGLRDDRYSKKPAVAIPFRDSLGRISGVHYRLDLAGDKNKRFKWRPGSTVCLYGVDRVAHATGYCVLVEGESDTQTLWLHGFPALGLPGASNWKEDRDAPLLKDVTTVYVVVEPDKGGDQVLGWLARSSIASRARLVRLAPETKDPSALHITNPDGFRAAFQRALDSAEPLPAQPTKAEVATIDTAAPFATAKLFLATHHTTGGSPTLHHHRDGFYAWNGAAYPELGETVLRARLYDFLDRCTAVDPKGKSHPVKPNAVMVGNVLDGLRAAAHLSPAISAPAWLDRVPDIDAEDIVACINGLLHLPTLTLLRHTPRFFTYNAVDIAFEPGAAEPAEWLRFLDQLWPGDPQAIETLQETFGYCLTTDTAQQKAFLLVGPKRSGKGTIARVLARLVGMDNAVAPTLAGLGMNFGLAPLIGKRVAIISDARLGGRADQHAIAERILSITGEDMVSVDRKFLPAWTGRLQTRFLILSNELPRLADASGALAARFIVLVLTNSFYGREDHGLTDRLLGEFPGILNWSNAGLRRLRARGHFVQPASAADAVQDLEDLGSPISAFLRERCIVAAGRVVEANRLFEVWSEWGKQQGRDHPGTAQTFGRDLRAAVPGLKVVRPRDDIGERHRLYDGIGLQ